LRIRRLIASVIAATAIALGVGGVFASPANANRSYHGCYGTDNAWYNRGASDYSPGRAGNACE